MTERENCIKALKRQNPEWIPLFHKAIQQVALSPVLERQDFGTDWFGVTWIDSIPDNIDPLLKDVCNWKEALKFPDVDGLNWGLAKHDCSKIDRENKIIWAPCRVGLFERMHSFMGIENTLVSLYTEPDSIRELINTYTDHKLKVVENVLKHYDPDIVSIHDDYGTQRALFMNPVVWREYFKENLKRIVDLVHSYGKIFVMHCCGKVDEIVGDFVEIGIDVWDSVQACCDLPALAEKYADKISFTPGLNGQIISFATPEEAREEVRRTIRTLGRFGGLMPHDSPPRVAQEVVDAIRDEIEVFGRAFFLENSISQG